MPALYKASLGREKNSGASSFYTHNCYQDHLAPTPNPKAWKQLSANTHMDFILGQLGGEQAIEVASERNPCIGKTTVFQEPEEFWLCKSKEKFGKLEVVVSTKPVKTFQVAA